jgi:N-acetyl-gamma-glutamyl-phosphate reductase
MTAKLPVGVIGVLDKATRYLLQLLIAHPRVEVTYVGSPTAISKRLSQSFPTLAMPLKTDWPIEAIDVEAIAARCQIVFLTLPLGQAVTWVPALLEQCRVIDLSADYRFCNLNLYQQCFQIQRQDFSTAVNAVYGLPEFLGEQFSQTRLVACPGSTPTAGLLALVPLLKRGFIDPDRIIITTQRGQSPAVPLPPQWTHHPDAFEIEHISSDLSGIEILLQFIPQTVPQPFGLWVTLCADLRDPGLVTEDLITIYRTSYQAMPWVNVLPAGQPPVFDQILGTNYCHLGIEVDSRTHRILVFAALDPHLKGQAGQAIQCLNLMQGWPETEGLPRFGYA